MNDITKDEMMETFLTKLGDVALPLKKLSKKELYALEQAFSFFEIETRCDAQDRTRVELIQADGGLLREYHD